MIQRSEISQIEHWLGKEKILILKGARQVGKTTLLQQLQSKLEAKGEKSAYILADDLGQQAIFQSPQHFIQYLRLSHRLDESFLYVFIDEFQVIEQAGVFLKNIFDQYKTKLQLIVSGSASMEITKNTEYLTGRAISFMIPRVSFIDFFCYRNDISRNALEGQTWPEWESFYQVYRPQLEATFQEYLIYGSYPEVLVTPSIEDKKVILSSIVKTYLEKDISYFFSIKNISAFNHLLKLLASTITQQLNRNELANTLQIDHSYVSHYLDILEGTFVCSRLRPYYRNIRSEVSKMPKLFFNDLGLRNEILSFFDAAALEVNQGGLVENFIFLELLRHTENTPLHYYRTTSGSEIDFVLENSFEELTLIEVKFRNHIKKIRAFTSFSNKYPSLKTQQIIVTKNQLLFSGNSSPIPAVLFPFILPLLQKRL